MKFQKTQHAFLKENPNYILYNDGRLFNIKRGIFLAPSHCRSGYLQHHFTLPNGERVVKSVHRLVAEYFVYNPNPKEYTEINHKDENKENNCAYNLEWCDRKYNVNYNKSMQSASFKNQIPIAKCDKNTHEIIQIYPSIRIAAQENNCTEQNIGQVVNGKQLSAKGYYWKKVN